VKKFALEKSKVAPNYNGNPISGVRLAGVDYYKNPIGDQQKFIATVFRVYPLFDKPQAGSWLSNFIDILGFDKESGLIQQVIERSEDIHSSIEDPYPIDKTLPEEEVNRLIELHATHGTFLQAPGLKIPLLAPGDQIEVSYIDVQNRVGGQIVGFITKGQPLSSNSQSGKNSFDEIAKSNFLAVKRANGGVLFNKDFAVTENPCLGSSEVAQQAGCNTRNPRDYDNKIDNLFKKGNSKDSGNRYKAKQWFGSKGEPATFCNFFVTDATSELGVGLPVSENGNPLSANQMIDYFETGQVPVGFEKFKNSNRGSQSWKSLSGAEAESQAKAAAAQGIPVVVGWKNPSGRSGHVAMMRSNGKIANVGPKNFANGPVNAGFGKNPVTYFVHQGE
jgi:hypothetical protein